MACTGAVSARQPPDLATVSQNCGQLIILALLALLLTNARVVDLLLFGSFLLWAMLGFRAARVRDRVNPLPPVPGTWPHMVLAIRIGIVVWLVFASYLHLWLIGVPAA